jgi:hypothetical protein
MPEVRLCPASAMEMMGLLRKCYLKVWMARSKALRWWQVGGKNLRHQLVLQVIGGEETIQSGGCLVVESLEFRSETLDHELLMDVIIGLNPFRGGPRFRQDEFNVVAVIDIADHDI